MKLTHFLYRTVIRTLELLSRLIPLSNKKNFDKESKTYICTIAFNNVELIEYQHKLLLKYVEGDYCYTVLDNSSDRSKAKDIRKFCVDNSIIYMRLPWNPLNCLKRPSYSHAAALNLLYRKFIKIRKPSSFALIDHDIFPIAKIRIEDYLSDQPFYGLQRHRGQAWYISPILAFFKYEWTAEGRFDFMPVIVEGQYLDTGGANWLNYYRKLDESSLTFPTNEEIPFRNGNNYHSDFFAYIDNRRWVHTINGSCWTDVASGKDSFVQDYLNGYLL